MSWPSTRLSTKSAKRQQFRKQMKLIKEINLAPRISRRGQKYKKNHQKNIYNILKQYADI